MTTVYVNFQIELEQLKMKFAKLEKERNDYKHAVDKLENKVQLQTIMNSFFELLQR